MQQYPITNTGRRLFEQIFRSLTFWNRTEVQGVQRPYVLTSFFSGNERNYDLEIEEFPIRDNKKAGRLIHLIENSSDAATAIRITNDAVWSSVDGDDQGWAIAPTLNDNTTPINPEVEEILDRLVREVIGGIALEPASERMLCWGDAFLNVGIDTAKRRINKVLFLPTWELFRLEDDHGNHPTLIMPNGNYLQVGFEQRRSLVDQHSIPFHPLAITHFRYQHKTLYGRGVFHASLRDWERLQSAEDDLAAASRATGINPRIHEMPENRGDAYRTQYKEEHESRIRERIITDYYLECGAKVHPMSTNNPDLKALESSVQYWRMKLIVASQVPPYLMGMPTIGAREIAGQPALAFARHINKVRMCLSEGIKRLCNLELALHNIPMERWEYRIIFPKISVSQFEEQLNPEAIAETNQARVEDLDSSYANTESDRAQYAAYQSQDILEVINNGRTV